ncbi:MAG: sugar transferase [Pseudomonadales bacterium]|nr:sugar transferase [Pseudomonadales bacterium]MBO6596384.1 sugar transferase [Pseudomonadales bacterium]MBO6822864.1 sugar transferase [Pseudomonadales bacterium]
MSSRAMSSGLDARKAKPLPMSSNPYYPTVKRIIDIVGSLSALVLLSPVFIITALAIKLESKGPILYSQIRVGQGGKNFHCLKFRSMTADADQERKRLEGQNEMAGGVLFKIKNDPRITRVGKLIRSFSIDELPQIWNVLVGDMSLVGPRPPIPSEVEHYTSHEMTRLSVQQGITCIWQVSGRSDIPFERQVELDIEYINRRSVFFDIKLILLTIPAVLSRKGAY